MYKSILDLKETERAVKLIKDTFEVKLAKKLNLERISAPLFVLKETGLNDDLNGIEKAVTFKSHDIGDKNIEIIHSLAKWKRYSLKKYNYLENEGIYTDMNAIRKDEHLDNLHSIYVDQWDWEKVINKHNRSLTYLKQTVRKIVLALIETTKVVNKKYPEINISLEKKVYFITTEELLKKYPDLSPKEREREIVREHKTVFLMNIGPVLTNGQPHDLRAPDYDDWSLNGDLLFYSEILDDSIEVSSMGIRVNKESLMKQLTLTSSLDRLNYPYHQAIINEELPYTIGGGIGQSRICMLLLKKLHIGEVQASLWSNEVLEYAEKMGLSLL